MKKYWKKYGKKFFFYKYIYLSLCKVSLLHLESRIYHHHFYNFLYFRACGQELKHSNLH